MIPSRLGRIGAGATLTSLLLVAWLGACSSEATEVCGTNGVKNGTCQLGPTCPSGSVEIPISDPADECPGTNAQGVASYLCCGPTTGGGASSPSTATDAGSAG